MAELISIIYPVFNVEDYIEESLKSVLSQDYPEIEVIAVNDGSTDGSLEILRKIASFDSRVKVINQENKGVAKARLVAIGYASGDYLCFVDSDDLLPSDSLRVLYDVLKNNDADISAGSYSKIFSDNKELTYKNFSAGVIDIQQHIDLLLSYKLSIALWGKLFKASLFRDARLVPFKISQDLCLLFQAVIRGPKVVLVDDIVYRYVQRPSSTMHTNFNTGNSVNYYLSRRWIADFVRSECSEYKDHGKLDEFILQGFAYTLCLGGKRFLKKEDIACCKQMFKNHKRCLPIGQRIVVQTIDISVVNNFFIKLYQIRIRKSQR